MLLRSYRDELDILKEKVSRERYFYFTTLNNIHEIITRKLILYIGINYIYCVCVCALFKALKAQKCEKELEKYKEKMMEMDFYKSRLDVSKLRLVNLNKYHFIWILFIIL